MSDIFYRGQFQKVQMGDYGFDILNVLDSPFNLNTYRIINFIEASEITFTNVETEEVITQSFPVNFIFYGKIKDVTMVSGSAIGYLGNERKTI